MNNNGFFLTFEGTEGTGKTTQIKLLSKELKLKKIKHIITREPGGTEISNQIRRILLNPSNIKMAPLAEMLLYAADRAQHVHQKIIPHLEKGYVVISDRYIDSTFAYQGYGRKLDLKALKKINRIATSGLLPDLTFILKLPVEEGLRRVMKAKGKEYAKGDRFEREALDFHSNVLNGYLKMSKQDNRFVIIDGTKNKIDVSKIISNIFFERYKEKVNV